MRDYAGFGYARCCFGYARCCFGYARCCFGYVSYKPPRDYAGFSYASLIQLCLIDSVMYPLNLHVIMRDSVMPRCCFVYVSLSLLIRLCSYSWLCIVFYINDSIL